MSRIMPQGMLDGSTRDQRKKKKKNMLRLIVQDRPLLAMIILPAMRSNQRICKRRVRIAKYHTKPFSHRTNYANGKEKIERIITQSSLLAQETCTTPQRPAGLACKCLGRMMAVDPPTSGYQDPGEKKVARGFGGFLLRVQLFCFGRSRGGVSFFFDCLICFFLFLGGMVI